jgi:hypothetical protein
MFLQSNLVLRHCEKKSVQCLIGKPITHLLGMIYEMLCIYIYFFLYVVLSILCKLSGWEYCDNVSFHASLSVSSFVYYIKRTRLNSMQPIG